MNSGPELGLTNALLAALVERDRQAPNAPALLAPGRRPMSHAGLAAQMRRTVARLNELGLGRGDAIAIALPNGPEMAVALLGVAAGAVAAPLKSSGSVAEFEQDLANLHARAVIVPAEGAGRPRPPVLNGESEAQFLATTASPAAAAARGLGIFVLELAAPTDGPAGLFELRGKPSLLRAHGGMAEPDDTALLLRTSGTSARARLAPILQRKLLISCGHIIDSLALSADDRCLHIVPLFHSAGLATMLIAPLLAGGSVVCAPAFLAPRFFDWLAEFEPTWYSAAPAVHQAILAAAARRPAAAPAGRLRFIRSVSAALPSPVLRELERIFQVPVIESYAMTEAVPIASNRLPPVARKPRSVGRPLGLEVAIAGEHGRPGLPPGAAGEIVIRGAHVIAGYLDDDDSNERAFVGGWFHTGDVGYLDEDGDLLITGRLKELINRGGVKIAPTEVEEALLEHPDVALAVAFALPDARLGEEVGAAVVARPGASIDTAELRRFVAGRLADFKVPRQVLVLDEIPNGPGGKLQRLGLAEKLGLAGASGTTDPAPAEYAAPETKIEELLAELWQAVLACDRVGRHDRFLDLGGDSILAMQLLARVSDTFVLEFSTIDFFDWPTIAMQAALIVKRRMDHA